MASHIDELRFAPGLDFAQQLDNEDELASLRDSFVITDPDTIYLDGGSLGRLPKRTVERMQKVITEEWGDKLIGGWRNAGWYDAPRRIGNALGRLLGAAPGQVIVTDSTSVNLFKLVMAALAMRPGRKRIVSDVFNFPTDLYVIQGCIRSLGQHHSLYLVPSADDVTIDQQALFDAIDTQTALVTISAPAFKSCFFYDMAAITERARQMGAVMLWDLSHAVGVVPIELDQWAVEMAVGCSYKYLNAGPGAAAWLYVRKDLQSQVLSPIQGWWGHSSPFRFDHEYVPADDISRFLAGTIPVLSLLPVEEGVKLILDVGIERLRRKSIQLTSYMIYLTDTVLAPLGFSVGTPRDPMRRGAHVLLRHAEAPRITEALAAEMKVVVEFRPPDGIRAGLPPLYVSFAEIWEAINRLRRVVEEQRYLHYSPQQIARN